MIRRYSKHTRKLFMLASATKTVIQFECDIEVLPLRKDSTRMHCIKGMDRERNIRSVIKPHYNEFVCFVLS